MKIAIFSDIHGNDVAFAAAVSQAKKQGADQYIIAGDLITDYPMSNAVIERARPLTHLIVKGNREQYLIDYDQHQYQYWREYMQFKPLLWTYSQLKNENLQYIKALPKTLNFPLDRETTLYVEHKIPRTRYDPLAADLYKAAARSYCQTLPARCRVFCTGHTHVAGIEKMGNRLLINAGSVGGNFAGGYQAEYVLLDWENGLASAQICYASYDEQAYIKHLNQSKMPNDTALKHWMQLMHLSARDGCNYLLEFFLEADRIKTARSSRSPYLTDEIWHETIRNFISRGILI